MAERPRAVFGPSATVLNSLRGESVTRSVSVINGSSPDKGRILTIPLAKEGQSAMVDLHDPWENREWAGIFNHSIKVAGAGLILGNLLRLNGYQFDEQLHVDIATVSHSGRRHRDENIWYRLPGFLDPDQTDDTAMGLDILKRKNLPDDFVAMVAVHGYPHKQLEEMTAGPITTWNLNMILPAYLDQRIAQNTMTLEARIEGHRKSQRTTEEDLLHLETWTHKAEGDIFDALIIEDYNTLLTNSQNMLARTEIALKLRKFTEVEASAIRATSEYSDQRRRRTPQENLDIAGAAGIDQERYLEALTLTPDDINEKFTQPERWERYLRRLYLNDAEEDAFRLFSSMEQQRSEGTITQAEIDKEFPPNTWWGSSMRELYRKQNGIPQKPVTRGDGAVVYGTARAIDLFERRERADLN